jgi:hypothetical protein
VQVQALPHARAKVALYPASPRGNRVFNDRRWGTYVVQRSMPRTPRATISEHRPHGRTSEYPECWKQGTEIPRTGTESCCGGVGVVAMADLNLAAGVPAQRGRRERTLLIPESGLSLSGWCRCLRAPVAATRLKIFTPMKGRFVACHLQYPSLCGLPDVVNAPAVPCHGVAGHTAAHRLTGIPPSRLFL